MSELEASVILAVYNCIFFIIVNLTSIAVALEASCLDQLRSFLKQVICQAASAVLKFQPLDQQRCF
jgi:hypothetical protein